MLFLNFTGKKDAFLISEIIILIFQTNIKNFFNQLNFFLEHKYAKYFKFSFFIS